MRTGPYLVREGAGVVEAWSGERLRFDVGDSWHRDFRDELRRAIRSLRGESLIAATYGSVVRDRCDTENILFYNVGAGCFAEVASLGIRFERRFDSPSSPDDLPAPALHYHRYERAAPGRPFRYWRERELLGDFSDVALPRLTEETKPVAVWLPVRRAVLDALPDAVSDRRSLQPFALRLRLRAPWPRPEPVRIIKPLLDGTIAAFQRHDGSRLDDVAQRLAAQLSSSAAEIGHLLVDRRVAPLGAGRLIMVRAAGVQWQPADDRCVACEFVVEQGNADEGMVLRGTFWTAQPSVRATNDRESGGAPGQPV
jgi:hypothetical protein